MKYQVGERVVCQVGRYQDFPPAEMIIYSDDHVLTFTSFSEKDFLILEELVQVDKGLVYLLLIEDPKIMSIDFEEHSTVWPVPEKKILRRFESNIEIYGGNCKRCGEYNPYAMVDQSKTFLCYQCSRR